MHLQPIGSYETKTHLADLLRQVREGQGFTINQRGEPVADLLPTGSRRQRAGAQAAVQMKALMLQASSSPGVRKAGKGAGRSKANPNVDIKALIDAGRD